MALNFVSKEVLTKIITKGIGAFRALYLLYFFGFSDELDGFFFAKSIISLVLMLNIFFEMSYADQLKKTCFNGQSVIYFWKRINGISSVFCVVLLFGAILVFNGKSIIQTNVFLLLLWALLNINSNFYTILFRYRSQSKIALFYFLFVAVVDFCFLILVLHFTSVQSSSLISISLLSTEFLALSILLFIFWRHYKKQLILSISADFNLRFSRKELNIIGVLIIISLIEVSDKVFLEKMGTSAVTYVTYGMFVPLLLRQALDVRSHFFVRLNTIESKADIKKEFFLTLKILMRFFTFGALVMFVFLILSQEKWVIFFDITKVSVFWNIVILGAMSMPFYMSWDMFYRLYFKFKRLNLLVKIVFLGLMLNIIANYAFGIVLNLNEVGIVLSTLLTFVYYNVVSLYVFKSKLLTLSNKKKKV